MKTLQSLAATLCLGLCLLSCQQGNKTKPENADPIGKSEVGEKEPLQSSEVPQIPRALADIEGAGKMNVHGTASFAQIDDQTVQMIVDVHNLQRGKHAIHLHEKGDCSARDATSAGGHWNPGNKAHGKRDEGEFHKGDITNLDVPLSGDVKDTIEVSGWTIGGPEKTDILGKAVIIHAGPDDFTSQPSGAAGPRIACGVIVELE